MVLVWTAVSCIPSGSVPRGIPRHLFSPNPWSPGAYENWTVIKEMLDVPILFIVGAFIPATMIAVLYYFDHSFNLRKPPSFHYDLLLLGFLVILCVLLGIPPSNGVIPQSPMHTNLGQLYGNMQEAYQQMQTLLIYQEASVRYINHFGYYAIVALAISKIENQSTGIRQFALISISKTTFFVCPWNFFNILVTDGIPYADSQPVIISLRSFRILALVPYSPSLILTNYNGFKLSRLFGALEGDVSLADLNEGIRPGLVLPEAAHQGFTEATWVSNQRNVNSAGLNSGKGEHSRKPSDQNLARIVDNGDDQLQVHDQTIL
uniref:Bicarbonate transporter-like transmembrane domain-containing protein n=1 Tax=Nelumbo nucifera TaxID=4432 RepID=A0A822XZN0_NELNU|nr:TPA_asm: hypothetical protein HUJ06_025718 [Nelumbo nucifera]